MLNIQSLKIKSKILLIIGLNALFLVVISALAFFAISKLNNSNAILMTNSDAIYNQLTADMMHDALRADVYNALLVDKDNPEQIKQINQDLKEHLENFQQTILNLEQLSLQVQIKKAVEEVKIPLADFSQASQHIIHLALRKDSASLVKAQKMLPAYKQSFDALALQMEKLSELIDNDSQQERVDVANLQDEMILLLVVFTAVVLAISLFVSLRIARSLVTPIQFTKDTLQNLSLGIMPTTQLKETKDEIGEMAQALNRLVTNFENVKNFALEVGEGKFDTQIKVANNLGELGKSMEQMRVSLQQTAQEEQKRSWAVSGIAEMADILRTNTADTSHLYNHIISYIVKYLQVNQGALFILEEDNSSESYLNLVACYAYDRKKYLNKRIYIGEGLAGQCVLEKAPIYLTDVSKDYIAISSGLGEATPTCVMIVPLKVNEQVLGVIELASFHTIEPYQMELVEKISENIAATISNVKINKQTNNLLMQAQQQTEELRSQEEEMKQNMEEMAAIQEEMHRKETEYLNYIAELRKNQ